MLASRAIRARMRHDITDEEAELVIDLDTYVTTQITCPVTGKVLDTRHAVLVSLPNSTHEAAVLDADTAEATAERFPGTTHRGPIPKDLFARL